MSRSSASSQQRQLSLPEELEKLEQSITLTLQEIDHNFSKAHRIVTSSILPIVEQYAEHSKAVWEGSKFWKQFFESSANVSLSGYEEQPSVLERTDETITEDSNATHTTLETSQSYETPSSHHLSAQPVEEQLDMTSLTISPSNTTPRPNANGKAKAGTTATFADYPSPYEDLRKEIGTTNNSQADDPHTPGKTPTAATHAHDIAMTPDSSPFLPKPTSIPRPSTSRKRTDPLLHRVLDRNYRVQATPMGKARTRSPIKATATPATATRQTHSPDLDSSPEPEAPQLHAEIFSSPAKPSTRPSTGRTPGISVLTPAKPKNATSGPSTSKGIWDDTEDEDTGSFNYHGMSPPKTMQFHVPQSRLLKTPAREASKRIVEDLLLTAGVGNEDDDEEDDYEIDLDWDEAGGDRGEPTSPSVVRRAAGIEDESF